MNRRTLSAKLGIAFAVCAVLVVAAGMQKQKLKDGEKINVNTASEADLMKLDGIATVKAKAIVAVRPFRSVDELDFVHGIGPKTLAKIRDHVVVEDAPAAPGAPAAQQKAPPAINNPNPAAKGKAVNPNANANGNAGAAQNNATQQNDPAVEIEKAYQARLANEPLNKLRDLLAEKKDAFRTWCSQNNMTEAGTLQKGFNAGPDVKEARLKEVMLWKRQIKLIDEEVKEPKKTKSKAG